MDFQRLFKRKEEGALPVARDNTREILNERDVLVREGELFEAIGGLINGYRRRPIQQRNLGKIPDAGDHEIGKGPAQGPKLVAFGNPAV